MDLDERVWRTLHAEVGTVQPLRSREIKAAVASHTQFEHMKKEVSDHQTSSTEGLTFVLQGANKITVPAIFPVTANVVYRQLGLPEVPSAATRKTAKGKLFTELRAMRFAAMQRPQERAAGRRRLVETRRQDGWIFAPYRTPACVQWSKLQGYGECLVKRASYMQRKAVGTVGTENDADKRHRKTTVDNNICTTQPGQGPGRQAHMGNNNNMLKGCCSSLLRFPPADNRRDAGQEA